MDKLLNKIKWCLNLVLRIKHNKKLLLKVFIVSMLFKVDNSQANLFTYECISSTRKTPLNEEEKVRYFYVTFHEASGIPKLNYGGFYLKNELYKTVTKDGNWKPTQTDLRDHTTAEFKNKKGQVILKRNYNSEQNDDSNHDTYYVYDDYGNLNYVLSPEGSSKILNEREEIETSILDNLCYQYRYDTRNRLIEKKIPGKGKEYIVYDKLDRPVLTQDANQRAKTPKEWLFTKYDFDGRVAYTGLYIDNEEREKLQNRVTTHTNKNSELLYEERIRTGNKLVDMSTELYYTSRTFPTKQLKIFTINYYDDYNWKKDNKLKISYDFNREENTQKYISTEVIEHDGYIQFTVPELNKNREVGFTTLEKNNRTSLPIDYKISLNEKGKISIYEKDVLSIALEGNYQVGDIFKVERSGEYILYKKNDKILHRGLIDIQSSLRGFSTFYEVNNKQDAVYIGYSHGGQLFTNGTESLKTGIKARVLGTSKWITTSIYYDAQKRPIYRITENNYLKAKNETGKELDSEGRTLKELWVHKRENKAPVITENYYTYNTVNRLIRQEQRINNQVKELILQNTYDSYGKLIKKVVGGRLPNTSSYINISKDVSIKENVIVKNSETNNNSELATSNKISEDGYVSYSVTNGKKKVMVGLSTVDNNIISQDMAYAIQNKEGKVYVYESGRNIGIKTIYVANDYFTIERRNGKVYYLKNNKVFYTSEFLSEVKAMVGIVFLYEKNASIRNLVFVDLNKGLQIINYQYNNKGQLKQLNNIDNLADDLFSFKLSYNDVSQNRDREEQSTSNIKEFLWRTNNISNDIRGYTYKYDALNRMVAAKGYNNDKYDVANIVYDKNGNIKKLQRRGHKDIRVSHFGLMDNLKYIYSGNKLIKVEELSGGSINTGFIDNVNSNVEYIYDANGNMLTNLNKNIGTYTSAGIVYNHLNLPTEVKVGNTNHKTVKYVYDATGVKQRKITIDNQNTTITDYIGNYIYEKNRLQFFRHPEGYVTPVITNGSEVISSYKYVYQYKDYFGNIRLSYTDNNNDGTIQTRGNKSEIIEELNYYPLGLQHKGYNNIVSSDGNSIAQKFRFNGKELKDELGLYWYDFGTRNYDISTGRWLNMERRNVNQEYINPYNSRIFMHAKLEYYNNFKKNKEEDYK
ncbi:conserved hypothetical protein [Tenacibaculum sp. 190524A02b]|uniref:YD repeat-containing protein n=1 Tax=Tenacibaculum vairaonense TaxID=3137860 RepID=A0ABM9PK86_9FLAO